VERRREAIDAVLNEQGAEPSIADALV